jgi:hypothetical protein
MWIKTANDNYQEKAVPWQYAVAALLVAVGAAVLAPMVGYGSV